MELERSSSGEDETDGGNVSNRGVGESVVPAEFTEVAADDKSDLVAKNITVTVTFNFEDPLGWDGHDLAVERGGDDQLPDVVLL